MEVMNSTEFEQQDVLIGGSGKTGKFTVNDDPHLMSMLSTSLYANPLRTMIQEIMFNAWDAHRMGNCQDKPIDVYINNTTGLIVRDYGPGINPEEIDKIYCTYGASTKRSDDKQTGGFGLGSKSPYAYNDSFMVSNHYGGQKSMYIMRRVHDDNDGGPGYDLILNGIETEEHGLLVTVPLKSETDKQRAYKYMKDILFLSGIKVNIHYEGSDEEKEFIEAESLAPGEFINSDMDQTGLYAVYGGVKYKIPMHDEYTLEYEFLRRLTKKLGALYIGFAPNSLTPLPNREGLNMRERSIESIKTQLEMIQEHFMSHMIPATKAALIESFRSMKSTTLQPQFLIYNWKRVGDEINLEKVIFDEDSVLEWIQNRRPDGMNASIWTSVAKMSLSETRFIVEMIGYEKFYMLKSLIWAKELPEYRHWRFRIAKIGEVKKQNVESEDRTNYAKWLISTQRKIEAITNAEQKPRVKIGDTHNWFILTNQRRAGKTDHIKSARQKDVINALSRKGKLKIPEKFYDDTLWFQKDGELFNHTMKHKTVIVAKTAAALSETSFHFQEIMIPRKSCLGYDKMHWKQWVYDSNVSPVAAFIVHKKNGNYDAVVHMLQDKGYKVIEADEPEIKTRAKKKYAEDGIENPVPTESVTFKVVNPRYNNWESNEEVMKPSTYLYCTKTALQSYDHGYNESLVYDVLKYVPKMVIVHNKAKITKLEKQGAISFESRFELIVHKLLSDKEKVRLMALHQLAHDNSELPEELLAIPEMQKTMGLPYLRSKQAENFHRDRKFLEKFIDRRGQYNRHQYSKGMTQQLRQKVTLAFEEAQKDDFVALVRKMAKASNCFNKDSLKSRVIKMKRGEQKMFAQKIARFLRTV